MIRGVVLDVLTRLRAHRLKHKIAAYRWWFRHVGSRRAYPVIEGRRLRTLREAALAQLEYQESVCNAGLLPSGNGYISVAKNQRFTLGHELEGRPPAPLAADDDRKLLYGLRFDAQWQLIGCARLSVVVDGRTTTPADGVEDVRLFRFADRVWAYATGSGNRRSAWPLIGRLDEHELRLSSVVAPYSPPQKNWMPFTRDGAIYLEYSVRPHVVLTYDPDTSRCETACTSEAEHPGFRGLEGLELHGGAPALRLDDHHFLGVCNSQRRFWYQDRYYAPLFYLFEANPPFKIVRVSRPVRLLSREERVQYVCGMALDSDRQTLTLSYGISDHDNCYVAVALATVLNLLGANDLIKSAS